MAEMSWAETLVNSERVFRRATPKPLVKSRAYVGKGNFARTDRTLENCGRRRRRCSDKGSSESCEDIQRRGGANLRRYQVRGHRGRVSSKNLTIRIQGRKHGGKIESGWKTPARSVDRGLGRINDKGYGKMSDRGGDDSPQCRIAG